MNVHENGRMGLGHRGLGLTQHFKKTSEKPKLGNSRRTVSAGENREKEEKGRELMEYRCVECGARMMRLFVQYSPGNIRLMKCGNCKAVADEYIECEPIIFLIDLILHKKKAYTHLLYNVIDSQAPAF